jgi:uncharacterized integral membrane protein
MRFLSWLFRAAVFVVLFAFALNNQHEAQLKWFFGFEFRTPMVLLVLVVFAAGAVFGVLAMTPTWWRQCRRHAVRPVPQKPAADTAAAAANLPVVPDVPLNTSSRDGI